MLTRTDKIRRKFGLFCIVGAGLMVVWGLTALKPRLDGLNYVLYWLVCFLLTGSAALTALLDMWIMGARDRKKELEAELRKLTKKIAQSPDDSQGDSRQK